MFEIGLEPGVQAGDDRHAHLPGERLRPGVEDVGGRDMDEVGGEARGRRGESPREMPSARRNSPRTGSRTDGTGTSVPSGSNAGVSVTGE